MKGSYLVSSVNVQCLIPDLDGSMHPVGMDETKCTQVYLLSSFRMLILSHTQKVSDYNFKMH